MKRLTLGLVSIALIATISGCKVGPNYKRPVVKTPDSYRGALAPDIQQAPGTSLGAQKWSEVFKDPVLQSLITEALKNNYDLKIAADRVLEEEAQVGKTRAGQLPTVSVGGSYTALGLPSGLLGSLTNSNNSDGSSSKSSSSNVYQGGLTTSVAWNLDFWGLYRRQTEAARAEYRSTQWGKQTTINTIIQNVATSYLQLRTLDAQLDITKKTIEARRESLRLTKVLDQGGSGTLADVRQSEQLLYAAQAQVPDLERQIEQQENSLSLLLGRSPGPIPRGLATVDQPHPSEIPAGLPSELLERRPDIRRAEELLVQANANIGVAKAQFFPALSLSGTGGTSSSQLKGIVDSKNAYWYAVGSLSQPIFQGGKLKNNLKLAKAQQQEMLDTYQQTIAGALRDVSNALVAYQKTRQYREEQEKQTAAAEDAVRLARMRYKAGSTSYLEVLTNDATLYTAQVTLATAQQSEALSLVQLYNALGGGWQTTQ